MIIVFDADCCLTIFPDVERAETHLEIVTIENSHCQICDERGRRFIGEITKYGALKPDEVCLHTVDHFDPSLPLQFIENAHDFSSFCSGITHIAHLKRYLEDLL